MNIAFKFNSLSKFSDTNFSSDFYIKQKKSLMLKVKLQTYAKNIHRNLHLIR